MRLHRFYIEQPLGEGELFIEKQELVHQLTHVFRYKVGDHVLVFSQGTPDFEYSITSLSKKSLSLQYVQTIASVHPKGGTLFMAIVKKDTFETIVRQATELGVASIYPILSARSEKKNLNLERLHAISVEASEQSGRNTIPVISPILTFKEALLMADASHILFDGEGGTLHPRATIEAVWVGPEGGWTAEEKLALKEKGVLSKTLGTTTLKADTAATLAVFLTR